MTYKSRYRGYCFDIDNDEVENKQYAEESEHEEEADKEPNIVFDKIIDQLLFGKPGCPNDIVIEHQAIELTVDLGVFVDYHRDKTAFGKAQPQIILKPVGIAQ